MTKAIVYVPSDQLDPHAARCAAYCQEQGYELVGIVRDDWEAVTRMLRNGEVSVVIVSDEMHLNPQRRPRIEVVANTRRSRWETRTRVIRRASAK